MGAGPLRLLNGNLAGTLRADGHQVTTHMVELAPDAWPAETQSAFRLARDVAVRVAAAGQAGAFPLILSGNCGPAALGAVAGLRTQPKVFWFDAHGDFNTPDTSISGFMDGTMLAALCGRCWQRACSEIDGFAAVREEDVVLIGGHDLDPLEQDLLAGSAVLHLRGREVIQGLPRRGGIAYLHIDLDVLDPAEGRVNVYAAPGGLSAEELAGAVQAIATSSDVRVASLTAYDPAYDPEGALHDKAVSVLRRLLAACDEQHA